MAEHTRAQIQKNHTNPEIKYRKIIKEYCNKTWLLNTNPTQPQTQLKHKPYPPIRTYSASLYKLSQTHQPLRHIFFIASFFTFRISLSKINGTHKGKEEASGSGESSGEGQEEDLKGRQ